MKALLIKLFLLYSIAICAQNTFNLRYHFGYPASVLTSIEVTDSSYYAMGVCADSVFPYRPSNLFIKFDLNGEVLSTKILTKTNKTYETWKNTLRRTYEGSFINAGVTRDSTMKLILIKYDSEGDTLFTKEYFNPYYPTESFITLQGFQTDPVDSTHLIVSTIFDPYKQANHTYLFKTDSFGEVIWEKIIYYASTLNNTPRTLEILPDRKYLIGAGINNLNITDTDFTYNTYLVQTDSLGEIIGQFVSPLDELRNAAYGIVPTDDGGFVIASGKGIEHISGPNSQLRWHLYLYKIDANLNFIWGTDIRDIEPSPDNFFSKIIASSDGSGYVAVGSIFEFTGGGVFNINGIITKISLEGDSLWTRYYNHVESPADYHEFNDVEETADGGFIMAGQAQDYFLEGEVPLQRGWLVKLDQYGCLVPGCHLIDDISEPSKTVKLDIYPNPASDYLNIFYYDPNHRGEVYFRIIDMQGKIIKQFSSSINNITHILSVNDLAAGQYFLTIEHKGEAVSKSFMVHQ